MGSVFCGGLRIEIKGRAGVNKFNSKNRKR